MTQPEVSVEPDRKEVRALVAGGGRMLQRAGERLQVNAIENVTQARTAVTLLQNMAPEWIKGMAPEKLLAFARLAVDLGLDPVAGECYVLHDTFYVSVSGRLKTAQRTGDFQGITPPRIPTKAEEQLYGVKPGDFARIVEAYRTNWIVPGQACGIVRAKEYADAPGFLPLKKQPEWMAEKRAIVAVLKKMFPDIDLPTGEVLDGGGVEVFDAPGQAAPQLSSPSPDLDVAFNAESEPAQPAPAGPEGSAELPDLDGGPPQQDQPALV